MRVRTEAKRQAILAKAAEAFSELGVEATSMSEIAARVGGSKATLYGYFSSKEELVLEILLATGEQHGKAALAALEASPDIRGGLQEFGAAHLQFITNPNTIAILRLAIGEGGRGDLGRQFYQRGPAVFVRLLASYLQQMIDDGKLTGAPAETMALHLKGLYEAETFDRYLFGAVDNPGSINFAAMATRAADAFLKIYGTSAGDKDDRSRARRT